MMPWKRGKRGYTTSHGGFVKNPEQYEAIKESYRKEHPNASEKEVKRHAAAIANARS